MSKGLREVSELFAIEAELLRIKAEVIRVAKGLFEIQPCLLEITRAGQAFDIPEGAHRKSSLAAGHAFGSPFHNVVAKNQRVFDQLLVDHAQSRAPAGIVRTDEFYQRHQQRRSINRF